MRGALLSQGLAAQLIWRAARFLTALFCSALVGAMRVAFSRFVSDSGSKRAEIKHLLYLKKYA